MELNLNDEKLVKRVFWVSCIFTIYGGYYDFFMCKMPITTFNVLIKIFFAFFPLISIYFFKRLTSYQRMFLAVFSYVIYCPYYTYNLSLAYLMSGIQLSFVFTILLIFELREFLILSILSFILCLLAGYLSPNLYSLSHWGMEKKGEDIENFFSLYVLTMISYALVTYPRLKKLKEEYQFSNLGKATSFILHEISKPIFNMKEGDEISKEKIDDLKSKLDIASQLQKGVMEKVHQKVNVKSILEEVISDNYIFLDFYKLDPNINAKDIIIEADPKLVKTIISNLVRNAIEAVSALHHNRFIEIDLDENKFEISNSYFKTVEEKDLFVPMKSSKSGNMGMGLYISKTLAENMNYDLKVSNVDNVFKARFIFC